VHVPDDLPVRAVSAVVGEQLTIALPVDELDATAVPAAERDWDALLAGAQPRGVLTEEQELAVASRRGALLVAAGAGSGKTAVLVERFVRAVLVDGIAPARILAITFTDRAAGELAQRLRARFLELGEREHARDVEAALVGTFHTFCARLLRLNALAAGLDPDFRVLDEPRAARLRADAFERALGDVVARRRDAAIELLAAYGAQRLREMVLGVYAELRSRGQEHPRLPIAALAREEEEAGGSECVVLDDVLAAFGGRYAALKGARGALDFDDLELRARALLEGHSRVCEGWRRRLELLMVDELQDVNHRQAALLGLLERENLFTVGDELQSIYGFRHADVELFRRRRETLAASGAALALTHNFRARAELLVAINALFAPRFGERYAPLRCGREDPNDRGQDTVAVELLLSEREWERREGGCEIPREHDGPAWRRAEAQLLAQRIAELIREERVRERDVAVLVRATTGLDAYARALADQGVATLAAVGGFWSHEQVRDLIAYLRVLANPHDELRSTARLPRRSRASRATRSRCSLARAGSLAPVPGGPPAASPVLVRSSPPETTRACLRSASSSSASASTARGGGSPARCVTRSRRPGMNGAFARWPRPSGGSRTFAS
jgi:ATP-dependent exoDNAse (exonuclease V) beta subunit